MKIDTSSYIPAIKEVYSQIDWDRFEDIDKALNFELWHGTANEYFAGEHPAEELEHYKWEGFEKAERDIREILEPLPGEIWLDIDGDGFSETDPDNYDGYWGFECETCDDTHFGDDIPSGHQIVHSSAYWAGGEWMSINPREVVMFTETWRQIR